MQIDLTALPEDSDALQSMIRDVVTATMQRDAQVSELTEENDRLRALIQKLLRHRFGRRSEQMSPDQLKLAIEDIEQEIAEHDATEDAAAQSEETRRQRRAAHPRRNLGALPAHLARDEMVIDVDSKECPCCGGTLHGIGPYLALKLVGECGTNLAAWPTAKHFTSWLGLAPHNKISGGKVLSSKTRRTGNRAASLLRLAAGTLGRTDTALGAFYRRLSARIGKAKAITATARKIATLFYNTLRHGMAYADPGAGYNNEHRHSGIKYVTPAQRHAGQDRSVLTARHELYQRARRSNPQRWSGQTRDWSPVAAVTLNPERDTVVPAAASRNQLSGSAKAPAFPSRPDSASAMARNVGEERSTAARSHAQRPLGREHGEDGAHRTFPEVSTMAHSGAADRPGHRRAFRQTGGAG